MFDPNRTIIGCVVPDSNKNYANLETEYLFRTLNKFGGEASKAIKWACFIEEPDPTMKDVLNELGVTIKIIKHLDDRDPYSHKIMLLEEASHEDIDYLVVLDTDIVIADDFSSYITGDSFRAMPANVSMTLDNWRIIFKHFDVKFPSTRVKTTTTGEETIPFYSSGVMIIPKKYLKILFETHAEFIHAICDQVEKGTLPKKFPDGIHLNEMKGLALSLAKLGMTVWHLPSEVNFTPIKNQPEEIVLQLKPKVIHYHHQFFEDGTIIPTPFENINKIIEKINDFLKKERKLDVTTSNMLSHITYMLIHEKKYLEVIERLKELTLEPQKEKWFPHRNAQLQFHLAKAYQKTGNLTGAIVRYSISLKIEYKRPFAIYVERGLCYCRLDQLEEAESDLKKAFEINPTHKTVLTRLAFLEEKKLQQNSNLQNVQE